MNAARSTIGLVGFPARHKLHAISGSASLQLRAVTDWQLGQLRARAEDFLVANRRRASSVARQRVRRALLFVLAEQQTRKAIRALPDCADAMEIHRSSDAELLDECRRAVERFRAAYGVASELSRSTRLEAARRVTSLQREWAHRHQGADLIAVFKRTSGW